MSEESQRAAIEFAWVEAPEDEVEPFLRAAQKDIRFLWSLVEAAEARVAALTQENESLRNLLAEWRQYTGMREKVRRALDDESGEYESGRGLLERTDAALDGLVGLHEEREES